MHKMILSWRHCHCIVLFAYFLSMLITAILLSRSCPIVDLKNVLMRRRALKDLSAEHELYIEQVKCHGDHFDAWSLPWRLRFFSGMGPRSRSFQRFTSHLIAFHYPRHRNLIQFGCCWCLENGWKRFRPMRTKPPGHCPQTLIEVHWQLCQYMCNKLWYESGLLPSVVSCRSLQQVSHLNVSLPERYISFARIILFFFRQGGLQPLPPAPYADDPRNVPWER